jgi:hypothetical protein
MSEAEKTTPEAGEAEAGEAEPTETASPSSEGADDGAETRDIDLGPEEVTTDGKLTKKALESVGVTVRSTRGTAYLEARATIGGEDVAVQLDSFRGRGSGSERFSVEAIGDAIVEAYNERIRAQADSDDDTAPEPHPLT